MNVKFFSFMTIGLLMLGMAACGDDDAQTCAPNCGQGGDGAGAQGGSGGSGAQGGSGGQGAQGGSGGSGGQANVCGGAEDIKCADGSFCDFQPSSCGAADETGVCVEIPQGCTDEELPTCGCDGQVYTNPCQANVAGVDISIAGGCPLPNLDDMACGPQFCNTTTHYCRRNVSDVVGIDDSFSCEPLPNGCGNMPDCNCLMNEACGDMCEADANSGLTLTCPGG